MTQNIANWRKNGEKNGNNDYLKRYHISFTIIVLCFTHNDGKRIIFFNDCRLYVANIVVVIALQQGAVELEYRMLSASNKAILHEWNCLTQNIANWRVADNAKEKKMEENNKNNQIKIIVEKNGIVFFNSSPTNLSENKYFSLGNNFKKGDAVSTNLYINISNNSLIPIYQQKTLRDEGRDQKVGIKGEEKEIQEQFLEYKRFQKKSLVFQRDFEPFSLFIKNEENSLRFLEILPLGEVKIWDILIRVFPIEKEDIFFLCLHQQWELHCYGGKKGEIRCSELETKKRWPEMVTLLNNILKNSIDIPSTPPPQPQKKEIQLEEMEAEIEFSSIAGGIAYGKDFKRRPVRIHWSSLEGHNFLFLKKGTIIKYGTLIGSVPANNPAGLPQYEAKEVKIIKQ